MGERATVWVGYQAAVLGKRPRTTADKRRSTYFFLFMIILIENRKRAASRPKLISADHPTNAMQNNAAALYGTLCPQKSMKSL